WIYDLRTNIHFTLKENPLSLENLKDFIKCYNPQNRHKRSETERFKPFRYEDLIKRDKVSLDIFWIKDVSLEDTENLPEPDILAGEIAESLRTAIEQFAGIYEDLSE
ncbi:MAG: SAM-dependent DNA methyltransferase, partial [Methanomicrobium sp.]|nr:SAM-dependent DNA methyltransferase [Methanomicrobium sp.]